MDISTRNQKKKKKKNQNNHEFAEEEVFSRTNIIIQSRVVKRLFVFQPA